MILPSTIASVWRTIGAHWFNQSYNAAVNFANRNASAEVPDSTLAGAYLAAVLSSVSIALGATAVTKRVSQLGRPALSTAVRATLPYTAVASAGCLNLALVRQVTRRYTGPTDASLRHSVFTRRACNVWRSCGRLS